MNLITQVAGYDVLEVLGYGASSTIFAVRDPKDGHVYALKRVVKRTPSDQRFIDQAVNEHNIAGEFDHEVLRRSYRIIRRRKFVRTSEIMVLMELVDGVTMETSRPNDMARLVTVFRDVALGLAHMHSQAYLHCDIKPNNILMTGDDRVKIIDFGQACPVGTAKQRIQGTPDYIAPEQVLRLPLSPQTDVFNLGATMYWCLTEHHVPTMIPRHADREIALKPDTQLRPPIERNPNVPRSLNALVLNCIETEPKDRPKSMKEVASRLDICLHQLSNGHSEGNGNGKLAV